MTSRPDAVADRFANEEAGIDDDSEYTVSAEYLHLLSLPMWEPLRPRLACALAGVTPASGPVLELGAGTGIGTDVVLDAVPNDVLAVEPSAQLRAVLLARLAGRADRDRVTVLPMGATQVSLPERLAAVVGMHMLGHLPPPARRALWAALAPRLAPGAPVVVNVQPPETAVAVPQTAPFAVRRGGLTYEGRGGAEPLDAERVRWRMAYRTLDGDTVLAEATAEYEWWVLSADGLADELATAGFSVSVDGDLVVGRRPASSR